MHFNELVTLYFERTNAMQTLWGIYVTIAIGLLGFLAAAKLKAPLLRIILLLTLAFFAFAFVNCQALRSVTRQRNVSANLIRSLKEDASADSETRRRIADTLDPPSVAGVTAFHVSADVLMIFAIWLLGMKAQKS